MIPKSEVIHQYSFLLVQEQNRGVADAVEDGREARLSWHHLALQDVLGSTPSMYLDMKTLSNHHPGRVDGLLRYGHVLIQQIPLNAQSTIHFPQPWAPEHNVLS